MRNQLFGKYPVSSVKIRLKGKVIETGMRHRSAPLRKPAAWDTDREKCRPGCAAAGALTLAGGN